MVVCGPFPSKFPGFRADPHGDASWPSNPPSRPPLRCRPNNSVRFFIQKNIQSKKWNQNKDPDLHRSFIPKALSLAEKPSISPKMFWRKQNGIYTILKMIEKCDKFKTSEASCHFEIMILAEGWHATIIFGSNGSVAILKPQPQQ